MSGVTFYDYLFEFDTENVRWFKIVFGNSLEYLPTRVCSSKVIWDILISRELEFNYLKSKVFRETFSEYFKWKLNKAIEPEIDSQVTVGR
jgi:hypothetical protein